MMEKVNGLLRQPKISYRPRRDLMLNIFIEPYILQKNTCKNILSFDPKNTV